MQVYYYKYNIKKVVVYVMFRLKSYHNILKQYQNGVPAPVNPWYGGMNDEPLHPTPPQQVFTSSQ